MVCSAPRLGMDAEVNQPRTFLERAELAETAGDLIAAGVLLREAVRQQMYAVAARQGALPAREFSHRSPLTLAQRLRQAALIGVDDFAEIRQMIHVGNLAAHCGHVDRELLISAIRSLHQFIDRDQCGAPGRLAACQIPAIVHHP